MINMTRINQPNPQDDWLADFADQVMEGRIKDISTVSADPEMRLLAETVLRLKSAFPAQATDAASARRVQDRVMAQARDQQKQRDRWNKFSGSEWFTQRRPRLAIAAMLTVLVLAVVAGPALFEGGGPISGAAGTSSLGWILWILFGVLAVAALLLTRRK
jgi:hypothetical protein